MSSDVDELDIDDTSDGSEWDCLKPAAEEVWEVEQGREHMPKLASISLSKFTELAFRMPREDGEPGLGPFSFKGRQHMRQIYDTPAKRILLVCARQVEKCGTLAANIILANGRQVLAKDIQPGDEVICLDMTRGQDTTFTTSKITWVSRVIKKPCVRVTTRRGHELELATTHPVRTWCNWVPAGQLRVGDRVAAVRRAGVFGEKQVEYTRIALTAFMLGDGSTTSGYSFTALPGATLEEFERCLRSAGIGYTLSKKTGTAALSVRIHKGILHKWLQEDGCTGKYAHEKAIPEWVFDLNARDTSLFLNRLWATDGHVKKNSSSKYSIEYCSTSRILVRQIQSLLWKFGIPSKIRKNYPSYVTKSGERARVAYILRIETQEGVTSFLTTVGALGKSEHIALPSTSSNNNRDTFPAEINGLITDILRSAQSKSHASLRRYGLRETLEYPPTGDKLRRYVEYFRRSTTFDQARVDRLEAYISSDVFWDEIVAIESIGTQECVDFEVDTHHNFLVDGVVTHNSTMLGNRAIALACLIAGFRLLYVSPTSTQTKTFSNDRINEPLQTSDILKAFTTSMLMTNIFEKTFVNWSKIILRNAFLNADRTRGVPAWGLALDEFQDILSDNIPIIEQCTSHAPERYKQFWYAGTPKGLDNNIEYYRSGFAKNKAMSTQGEWVVPCDHCGIKGTGRYWNILGEKNIGKIGLICERCGSKINPQHPEAQWANQVADAIFESYRIPQLMVPWKQWDEILLDYERYPRDKFYNEVLGLSYDSGMRPLTKAQIRDCCDESISMFEDDLRKYLPEVWQNPVFAGLDHGTGEHSFTVLSLGTYIGSKFTIFYIHRFAGIDLDVELQKTKILEVLTRFNVAITGSDYGGGHHMNDVLTREFGPTKLAKFQYAARARRKVEFHPKLRRFIVFRTELMSDIFNAIKRKNILRFPRWEEFQQPYAQDMCNITSEYNETLRMTMYGHRQDRPDDSFHSILYCFLASMIRFPRQDVIVPMRNDKNNEGPGGGVYVNVDQGSSGTLFLSFFAFRSAIAFATTSGSVARPLYQSLRYHLAVASTGINARMASLTSPCTSGNFLLAITGPYSFLAVMYATRTSCSCA